MKKRTYAIIIVVLFIVSIAIAVFIEQRQILRREFGIEPTDKIKIARQACDFRVLWSFHYYEIVFGSSEYDEVMDKLYSFFGRTESFPLDQANKSAQEDGLPTNKDWMDTEQETIIWWIDAPAAEVSVTQGTDGNYRAYICWNWVLYSCITN